MALLIVEHDGKVQAGVISGRVVVGRRPEDQVRVADKAVSRVHAWIGTGEDGTHFIADAGSKTGTLVNDQRVVVRKALQFGDEIRIGPLVLRLAEGHTIPPGTVPVDLHERPSPAPSPAGGISFNCACGAPVWVPWSAAGRSGTCRACGAAMSVPRPTDHPQPAQSPHAATMSRCGVCHGAIQPGEETTRCSACKALFHIECWTENGGCSVYGCSQVGAITPPPPSTMTSADWVVSEPHDPGRGLPHRGEKDLRGEEELANAHAAGLPWAYILLAASVLGAVVGTLTFGGTSLLVAAGALMFLIRSRPQRQRKIVFLSIAVSLIGTLAGVAVSYYWWMG